MSIELEVRRLLAIGRAARYLVEHPQSREIGINMLTACMRATMVEFPDLYRHLSIDEPTSPSGSTQSVKELLEGPGAGGSVTGSVTSAGQEIG